MAEYEKKKKLKKQKTSYLQII